MAKIQSLNPAAAATLVALRDQMHAQMLAHTALQATWQKHRAETAKARAGHKKRPPVRLI